MAISPDFPTLPELRLENHAHDPAATAAYAQLEALRIGSVLQFGSAETVRDYLRKRVAGLFGTTGRVDDDLVAALACLGFLEEYLKPYSAVFGAGTPAGESLSAIAGDIFAAVGNLPEGEPRIDGLTGRPLEPEKLRRKILGFAAAALALLETPENIANAQALAYRYGEAGAGPRRLS